MDDSVGLIALADGEASIREDIRVAADDRSDDVSLGASTAERRLGAPLTKREFAAISSPRKWKAGADVKLDPMIVAPRLDNVVERAEFHAFVRPLKAKTCASWNRHGSRADEAA
jgi:hypothetical protein